MLLVKPAKYVNPTTNSTSNSNNSQKSTSRDQPNLEYGNSVGPVKEKSTCMYEAHALSTNNYQQSLSK